MNIVIHRSETRGHANHGWLDTYHTFSFGMYHEASRMHFGMLRVLNDDFVIGGYNASETELVNFLQLWIFPKERNIQPRYDQLSFSKEQLRNQLEHIVSASKKDGTLWINQDAELYLGEFDISIDISHAMKSGNHGVYVFVIEGSVTIGDITLNKRDGIGIYDVDSVLATVHEQSKILLIEVPMK